jgi:hypothetical protein
MLHHYNTWCIAKIDVALVGAVAVAILPLLLVVAAEYIIVIIINFWRS